LIFVQMGYNAGFARANNAGMAIATGKHLLILNTDTVILNGAIDKSIRLLKQYPAAVACGVQLLNPDGSTQISGAHIIKGGLNTLLPLPYLGRMIRYLGYRFSSTIPSVQNIPGTIEVDWIVGAFILVQKEVLATTGLFDNDFFMYAEEIEWCGRLRKAGKLLLFAEPTVLHIGGGTSGDYYNTEENENGKNLWDIKGRQIIVSTMLRIRKQFGVGWFLVNSSVYFVGLPVFAGCLLLEKLVKGNRSRYQWKNVAGYAVNMSVLLRYYVKLITNQSYFYKVD